MKTIEMMKEIYLKETMKETESVVNYYLASSHDSGITISTSGWTLSAQEPTEDKRYLWCYTVITYTDGTSFTSAPFIRLSIGEKGVR